MGMFDYIKVEIPGFYDLEEVPTKVEWQTKDTPAQQLDTYRLTRDGLIHEAYDTRYEETKDAPLGFYLHRENRRDEFCNMTTSINFYDLVDKRWWEFCAFIVNGKVTDIHPIALGVKQ
jgi:hypothetical protein